MKVYNFRVQGYHNYFVTDLRIWTHNCGGGGGGRGLGSSTSNTIYSSPGNVSRGSNLLTKNVPVPDTYQKLIRDQFNSFKAPKGTGQAAQIPRTGTEWNNYYKSKYGSGNVTWITELKSYDDILSNPKALWGKPANEVGRTLGDGWTKGTYGSAGTGWKFINGDKSVFYHPGGGVHEGAYIGFSSGQTGKVKVVGPDYKPLPGDKAIIIQK
ncbi:hypothetical protein MH117_10840 [Paenibacillus sp. ACRRX]|uniref:hypothetical protein n=1 Tax=Paenibacillus sp. ACRRX TaxID=2918206 RepID=UPI001EF4404C|nr:hypothetical protein [Paenibacillus sp. ACRRX]MCG7407917.1 hypothetical protein [Paenibacillus sp. ACRRX]